MSKKLLETSTGWVVVNERGMVLDTVTKLGDRGIYCRQEYFPAVMARDEMCRDHGITASADFSSLTGYPKDPTK